MECTVTHSYWLVVFVPLIAADCWRGRGAKLSRIIGKKTQKLINTLYIMIVKQSEMNTEKLPTSFHQSKERARKGILSWWLSCHALRALGSGCWIYKAFSYLLLYEWEIAFCGENNLDSWPLIPVNWFKKYKQGVSKHFANKTKTLISLHPINRHAFFPM